MAKRGKEQGRESAQGRCDSFYLLQVPCSCCKPTSTLELLALPSMVDLNKAHLVVCLPLTGCCSESALSSDATSWSWFHCEPPLSFSCVLEEVTFELTSERESEELSSVCFRPGFKPRHPVHSAHTLTLGPGARACGSRVHASCLLCVA